MNQTPRWHRTTIDSPIGTLTLVADDDALVEVHLPNEPAPVDDRRADAAPAGRPVLGRAAAPARRVLRRRPAGVRRPAGADRHAVPARRVAGADGRSRTARRSATASRPAASVTATSPRRRRGERAQPAADHRAVPPGRRRQRPPHRLRRRHRVKAWLLDHDGPSPAHRLTRSGRPIGVSRSGRAPARPRTPRWRVEGAGGRGVEARPRSRADCSRCGGRPPPACAAGSRGAWP